MKNEARICRRTWLALAAVGVTWGRAPLVYAQESPARQVIHKLVAEAFEVLRNPSYAKAPKVRMAKLREVADRAFDWEAMARSSLGPHWRKRTEGERQEFIRVFKELLARQYMDDLDRFRGTERIEFKDSKSSGQLETVHTVLVTHSRERLPIDYTLQGTGGVFKVEDFSVEGVSLVNHYRKTFARFLVNSDFSTLIKRLKRRVGLS